MISLTRGPLGSGRSTRSFGGPKRLQLGDGSGLVTPHGMPEVPILLQPEPEVGGHAHDPCESQRSVRGHTAPAANHFIQTRARNTHS